MNPWSLIEVSLDPIGPQNVPIHQLGPPRAHQKPPFMQKVQDSIFFLYYSVLTAMVPQPELNNLLGDLPLTRGEVTVMTQRKLSALVDEESHSRLIEATAAPRELARLKCISREGAGDWLTALPSKTLGLHLRKTEFITAIRYRLGLPIFLF